MRNRRPTQATRLLRMLRAAGPQGVRTIELLRHPAPDGGPPILRPASRVVELRDDGHRIETRRAGRVAVYVLHDRGDDQ